MIPFVILLMDDTEIFQPHRYMATKAKMSCFFDGLATFLEKLAEYQFNPS